MKPKQIFLWISRVSCVIIRMTKLLKGGFTMYTNEERKEDFDYFVKHYQELYGKYGHKFIAIKNGKILGVFD